MSGRAVSERLLLPGPRRDLRGVAFFVLVPLALAVMTATTTGYSRALGYGGALLYVSLLSLIPWWIGEGTTRLVWICTRSYRPPLWLLCGLGALAACVFVGPYVSLVSYLFGRYWPIGDAAAMIGGRTDDRLLEGLMQVGRAVVFWIAANYVFDRLLGYPRFRNHDVPSRDEPPGRVTARGLERGRGGLLQCLSRIKALSDITFVKAEEHYVRVHSEQAEELVAYRFGMALKDLEGEDGFQVHRSYWVRRSAVVGTQDSGSRLTLEIKDGSTVPVSRPYHALIRQVL